MTGLSTGRIPGRPHQVVVAVATASAVAGLLLTGVISSVGLTTVLVVAGLLALVAGALIRPLWACALVLAATTVGNRALPGAPLGLQVVHGVCVLALAAVVLSAFAGQPIDRLKRPEPRLPLLFGAALVLAGVVSTLTSVSPEKSAKAIATLAAGLLLAVALVIVGRTGRRLRVLLATATMTSPLITVSALAGAGSLTAVYGGSVVKNRPTSTFADPNELGSYAAITFFLAVGWFFAARHRWERWAAAVMATGLIGALALSLSRGAWLGTAVGAIVLVVLHPHARRPAVWLVLAGATVGLFTMLLFPASGPVEALIGRATSVGDPAGNPYDVRPITWREALREYSEEPVLGNGPGTFSVLSAQSPSVLQFYPRQHAHNAVLTIAAEMGSVGVLAFAGMVTTLVLAVRGRARRLRGAHRWQDLGILAGGSAALAALGGHLLVDYPLRNPVLMVTVWTVVGIVLAATATPAAPRRGDRTIAVYAGGGS